MTNSDVRSLFHKVFKGHKNGMTPNIVRYGTRGKYCYELSKGYFSGETIYGVTVLEQDDGKHRTDLGGMFNGLKEANAVIKTLKEYE